MTATEYVGRHRIPCDDPRCVAHGPGHWHQDYVGRSWVSLAGPDEDCAVSCCDVA